MSSVRLFKDYNKESNDFLSKFIPEVGEFKIDSKVRARKHVEKKFVIYDNRFVPTTYSDDFIILNPSCSFKKKNCNCDAEINLNCHKLISNFVKSTPNSSSFLSTFFFSSPITIKTSFNENGFHKYGAVTNLNFFFLNKNNKKDSIFADVIKNNFVTAEISTDKDFKKLDLTMEYKDSFLSIHNKTTKNEFDCYSSFNAMKNPFCSTVLGGGFRFKHSIFNYREKNSKLTNYDLISIIKSSMVWSAGACFTFPSLSNLLFNFHITNTLQHVAGGLILPFTLPINNPVPIFFENFNKELLNNKVEEENVKIGEVIKKMDNRIKGTLFTNFTFVIPSYKDTDNTSSHTSSNDNTSSRRVIGNTIKGGAETNCLFFPKNKIKFIINNDLSWVISYTASLNSWLASFSFNKNRNFGVLFTLQ